MMRSVHSDSLADNIGNASAHETQKTTSAILSRQNASPALSTATANGDQLTASMAVLISSS